MSPQAKNLLDVATAFAELYIKINIKADNRDHETLKKIIIASYIAGVYATGEVASESRLSPTAIMSACHEVGTKLGFSINDLPTE